MHEHAFSPGEPELAGDEHGTVPWSLLAQLPVVRSRVGIDAAPPDLRTDGGVRLARAYPAVEVSPNLVRSTAALTYMPAERRERARALLAESGVPFVEADRPRDGSHDYYGLFVDGDEVAHAEFHGAWLDWRA